MLHILALDPQARLSYSDHTGKWYMSTHLRITEGWLEVSASPHKDSPELAVAAYLEYLKAVEYPDVVIASFYGERRLVRWNGATFAEVLPPT
jgi:hypothetical protein